MIREPHEWRPGSFTKNFSWGPASNGLVKLHRAIRVCFSDGLQDVPRQLCIERLENKGYVWHIPLNFFLLNTIRDGESYVKVDELVYQAVSFDHSKDFDKLALVCFNNSYVGSWAGAFKWQKHPAVWASNFIRDNISKSGQWDTSGISADRIERFLNSSGRYLAQDGRKVSTNLNYMYKSGDLTSLETPFIERWWVDAAFLTLDRSVHELDLEELDEGNLSQLLIQSRFLDLSGTRSKNKELAIRPIASLYAACGGQSRWSREAVQERQKALMPDISWFANSDDPFYAIYPRDPNIIKVIPRICALLAKGIADFDEIDAEDLIDWNPLNFIRRRTRQALDTLKSKGVKPTMSAEELLKLTRG